MTSFENGLKKLIAYAPALIMMGGLTTGCDSLSLSPESPPPAASKTTPDISFNSPLPTAPPKEAAPKPLIMTLEVRDPFSELKIKPGMFIQKGQIIADQEQERLLLTSNKKNLEAQLENLGNNRVLNASTEAEERTISIAQEQLSLAKSALASYQQESPWTDFARNNLPIATEELQQSRLQANIAQAENNLKAAQLKLSEKRKALSNYQQQQSSQKTQIQTALVQIEKKLLSLKPITSPHSGTITKIDLPGQAPNQPIKVTVTLLPGLTPNANKAPVSEPLTPNPLSNLQPLGNANDLLPLQDPEKLAVPNPASPPSTPSAVE